MHHPATDLLPLGPNFFNPELNSRGNRYFRGLLPSSCVSCMLEPEEEPVVEKMWTHAEEEEEEENIM